MKRIVGTELMRIRSQTDGADASRVEAEKTSLSFQTESWNLLRLTMRDVSTSLDMTRSRQRMAAEKGVMFRA